MLTEWFQKKRQPPFTTKLLLGAAAGFVGAAAMSGFMGLLKRRLPEDQQYALPPRLITLSVASRAGLADKIDEEPATTLATGAAHFGYGAMGGAVYAAAASKVSAHPFIKGSVFAILVWAASYMGWLPAFGIFAPATRQPSGRRNLMIGAHLVWGLSTAYLYNLLEKRR